MKFGVCIAGKDPLPTILEQVKLAEELGYESVWFVDSQLLCRELYVTLTACALSTSRIRIGSGVTAPATRHASVTASAFATLNEIAEGRVFLGISTGMSLVSTIGSPPAKIRDLEQYVQTLKGLLDNRQVRFEEGATGGITWLDAPCHIPIYVAASRPRLVRAAARMSDNVVLHVGATRANLDEGLRLVGEGAKEAGKSIEEMDVACYLSMSLAPDRALARMRIEPAVATMLGRRRMGSFEPNDRPTIRRIIEEYGSVYHSPAGPRPTTRVPDKFIDTCALAGNPAEVRQQVRDILETPGLSQIVVTLPVAQAGFPSVESVMRDFAEGVIAPLA